MKRNLLTLVLLLLFAVEISAQESGNVAMVASKASLVEGKTTGKFKITLPSGLAKQDVDKSASYYVHNFTVNFDDSTKIAEVNMVTNDERSRQIIVRFLSA